MHKHIDMHIYRVRTIKSSISSNLSGEFSKYEFLDLSISHRNSLDRLLIYFTSFISYKIKIKEKHIDSTIKVHCYTFTLCVCLCQFETLCTIGLYSVKFKFTWEVGYILKCILDIKNVKCGTQKMFAFPKQPLKHHKIHSIKNHHQICNIKAMTF